MDVEPRRQAIERAYRDHAGDVYRIAYAIVRDPDAAMDVTQETFARAFERWHQYDANRPLRAWLHGIGAHASLDALRRGRVRAAGRSGPVAEIAMAAGGQDSDPAVTVPGRQVIEAALGTLKPAARAAVVLRHYYGYDYEQIAALLGTRPGTVGSLLSRSHAVLRERLSAADDAAPNVAAKRRASR